MSITTIGVVGSGAMGTGIAHTAAQAGFQVILQDIDQARVDKSIATMDQLMHRAIAKGKLTDEQRQATLSRLHGTTDLGAFAAADYVIEAIFEEPTAKKALFQELDRICRPEVVLASNTSSISITDIASATKRPGQVVGMHFFNPVQVMRLCENTRGYYTTDDTMQIARSIGEQLGKTVVECQKDSPGFIVNRILIPMMAEAIRLVEEGVARPEDVDTAIRLGLNHPMGPFELCDFTGVDICYNVMEYFHSEFRRPEYAPPQLIKQMVRAGRLGKKTGRGFYEHQ